MTGALAPESFAMARDPKAAFTNLFNQPPEIPGNDRALTGAWVDTVLGAMLAIADQDSLLFLEFLDRPNLERHVGHLLRKVKASLAPGRIKPIDQIVGELDQYFSGTLTHFSTPLALVGTEFQRTVWNALLRIPFGETRAYSQLAAQIGRPTAVRAVGRANGSNRIAIVVPCHRLTGANGDLTGYGGGLERKRWLIDHEAAQV